MLKVAFFGTSDRALPILESLKNTIDLVLCITKEDSKVGRHQTIKESGVKSWAKQNRVNYVTISSGEAGEITRVIEQLLTSKSDLGVVADFSFILPEKIIQTPSYKLINIHFSLLPKYRGASPVQTAILNGDNQTGITYYLMDKGMDTGPLLHQVKHKLKGTETAGNLYKTLFEIAAQNLPKVINSYVTGKTKPQSQNKTKATYCYSKTHPKSTFIYKEDAKINWNDSPTQIERQIRAFHPWPIAHTTLGEMNIALKSNKDKSLKVKIYEAELDSNKKLQINKLQVAGSKVIEGRDFINGYLAT